MKLELKPQVDSVTHRTGSIFSDAEISKDGAVRWVTEKAYLEVRSARSDEILASWRFGKVLGDKYSTITAVTDVKTKNGLLLLVATSGDQYVGMISIFSVSQRKVIRSIAVPRRISSVETIFASHAEDVPQWVINKHLMFFCGLLAVGTDGGYIYLLDLCLDELFHADTQPEANPRSIQVIHPSMVDVTGKRSPGRHLALLVDDKAHRQEYFYYRRQDDSVQKVFEEDSVTVTCLSYVQQTGTLAVGYNFGCFQLWRLCGPVLDYSTRYSEDSQCVTHFVVQEPENDPRNFVYLWAGYDTSDEDRVSNICLYQLSYAKKDVYANFGVFYDELESVCARLDHRLTCDPHSSAPSGTSKSTIVCCFTLCDPHYAPPHQLSDSFEEGHSGNDLSLSVFVWKAESHQGGRSSASSYYYMSIFDINRWYHAQMPHSLRCHGNSVQVCSFWAVYNLNDALSHLVSCNLLNVEVDDNKIFRLANNMPVPPEEHSYPSAMQLPYVKFIMEDGVIKAHCNGWQCQLLEEMTAEGGKHLVQPADFYHQCLCARLIPQNYDEMADRSTSFQRKMLLNMLLEWGWAPSFIPNCIREWDGGQFAEYGCTLSLLLSWAWDSVIATKSGLDSACAMLYDWSGMPLDRRTDWQIKHLTANLTQIQQVFSLISIQAQPQSDRGQLELELRTEVVTTLLEHCELVRWAIWSNILPEVDEASDEAASLFAFPLGELGQLYRNRRAELATMKGKVDGMSLLLIDQLVESEGPYVKQVWESFGGSGEYPPPSMQAIMNMYLLREVSKELKQAITLYFLQDLAALDKSSNLEASFVHWFMLSPSLVHQIQGIWSIDHRDYEEGVRQNLNANVRESLFDHWKRTAIVNTLLAQGQGHCAAYYMHSKHVGGSFQERQLVVSVLVNNRQISQAVEFVRRFKDRTSDKLLTHLLSDCRAHKLLGQLLQVHLTENEEIALEDHLRATPEPHALEPLLLYYLRNSKYLKAFRLNEEMKTQDKFDTSATLQEKAASRNRLVEAYQKVLPSVTREMLLDNPSSQGGTKSIRRIQLDKRQPLSTVVKQADFSGMSHACFLVAAMDKINEAKIMLEEQDEEVEETRDNDLEQMSPDVSPVASYTHPSSARKVLTHLETLEDHSEKCGLQRIAAECMQVLQTPVRSQKRQPMSPRRSAVAAPVMTPQSILKVSRLSKSMASSKEGFSSRRSSALRQARRPSSSKSDTTQQLRVTTPTSPTTPTTPAPANTTISATPKQLRFIGVSPSPSSVMSPASEKSAEGAELSLSEVEVLPAAGSAEGEQARDGSSLMGADKPSSAVTSQSVEDEQTTPGEMETSFEEQTTDREMETSFEGQSTGVATESNLEAQTTHGEMQRSFEGHTTGGAMKTNLEVQTCELEKGSPDRYEDKLGDLIRPDLQSPWKQLSPPLTKETAPRISSEMDDVAPTGEINDKSMAIEEIQHKSTTPTKEKTDKSMAIEEIEDKSRVNADNADPEEIKLRRSQSPAKEASSDEIATEFERADVTQADLGDMSEEGDGEDVHGRRRSMRLNTPTRSEVDQTRQREITQNVSDSSSFRGLATVVEEKEKSPEPSISESLSRRSTRQSKTPEPFISESPTRKSRHQSKTPEPFISESPTRKSRRQSKTPEPFISESPTRKSRRQSKTPEPFITESPVRKSGRQSKTPEPFITESPVRKSGRQSKTPEPFISESLVRKSTRLSKTPEPFISESPTRKFRRQSKTPEPFISESPARRSTRQSKTPERLIAKESETADARRSKRQSKTPQRFIKEDEPKLSKQTSETALKKEQSTPTRRSRRQPKSPQALNTDEIEPVFVESVSHLSPKRSERSSVRDPATPPRMLGSRQDEPHTANIPQRPKFSPPGEGHKKANMTEVTSRKEANITETMTPSCKEANITETTSLGRIEANNTETTTPGHKEANSTETTTPGRKEANSQTMTPSRRSARKPRSPERLNTDEIQPLAFSSSPRDKGEVSKDSCPTTFQATESQFIFSPPVGHSITAVDIDAGESSETQFVFSKPSVVTSPEKQQVKPKRKRQLLRIDEEVDLLPLSPDGGKRRERRVKARVSEPQRAASDILKTYKKRAEKRISLVPRNKRKPSN